MEMGDCGLMFLAEEPADKDETGIKKKGGGCVRNKGAFKPGRRFLSHWMTQRESRRR